MADTAASPFSAGAVVNMAVMFGVIQLSSRLDLENPKNLTYLRALYVATQLVCFGVFAFVYHRVSTKRDRSTLIYEEPAPPLSGEQPTLRRTTVADYDKSEIVKAVRTQVLGVVVLLVMHLYFLYVQPLFIQAIFGVRTIYQLPLFKIYVLGRPATGDLARPWSSGGPFSSKPSAISEKEAEQKERRSAKARINAY